MDTSGGGVGGSGSPSPPTRRSRSRYQFTSQRRQRSWSPKSPSSLGRGGSRSRSWSRGASIIRPPIASAAVASPEETITTAAAAAVEGGEVKKTLYIFFCYASASIDYSLYAINLTIPLIPPPPPLLQPCNQSTELTSIYPILEFPRGEYPTFMCCVEFESKLYFLGGQVHGALRHPVVTMSTICPPDVYVLDTTTISATSTNTATSNRHPSELLKKDSTMNTGKANPYAIVAFRKIYVIGAYCGGGLSLFEVFDLDSSTWSILPQPPCNAKFSSHAVVDRMIFFVTYGENIFSFNVDTCEWSSRYFYLVKPFYGRANFIEDTLYSICRFPHTIAAYGLTTSKSNPAYKAKGLFNRIALLSPEVGYAAYAIEDCFGTIHDESYLVHLGNRIFSYVSTSKFRCPNNPGSVDVTDPEFDQGSTDPTDPEKLLLSITTIEFLNDTFTESSIAGVKSFFKAKLLHAAHFAARTKSGVDANTTIRLHCCLMSTSAS